MNSKIVLLLNPNPTNYHNYFLAMKNIFLLASIGSLFLFGCNSQPANEKNAAASDSTQTAVLYVCPMHPEITSVKADTCSICGMDLEKK